MVLIDKLYILYVYECECYIGTRWAAGIGQKQAIRFLLGRAADLHSQSWRGLRVLGLRERRHLLPVHHDLKTDSPPDSQKVTERSRRKGTLSGFYALKHIQRSLPIHSADFVWHLSDNIAELCADFGQENLQLCIPDEDVEPVSIALGNSLGFTQQRRLEEESDRCPGQGRGKRRHRGRPVQLQEPSLVQLDQSQTRVRAKVR